MKIKIAEKLKPFSHTPGASCPIPGTCYEIEAFPTLLRIGTKEIKLKATGPVSGFTLELDLEKNCVRVFGTAKEGYYRLRIEGSDSGFDVVQEKGKVLEKSMHIPKAVIFAKNHSVERLSLGSHKSQDWDIVKKRGDLATALPIIFALGQKVPKLPSQKPTGTATLLTMPEERKDTYDALDAFFKAAFTKLLVPRLIDDQHHGVAPHEKSDGNPYYLLQEGAKMIRSLFFEQNERRLKFLPKLPVPFHAGRMIGLKVPGVGEIDFEWSKGLLRQVHIRATTAGEILLQLQKDLKSFRVNKKGSQKANEPVLLQIGKTYILDRFQK